MRWLRNLSSGNFSTSKKSGERKWVSRSATPVSMLDASMLTSTDERETSASSSLIEPEYLPKRPRTFETTMWRTEKLMPVCAVSMFQLLFIGVSSRVSERRGRHQRDLHAPLSCVGNRIVPSIGLDCLPWNDYPAYGTIHDRPQ